jgi:hypothetical protein
MNLPEQLAVLREEQQAVFKAQTAFTHSVRALEKELDHTLLRCLKRHGLEKSLQAGLNFAAGSNASGWDPHFFISHINQKGKYGSVDPFICIDGSWVKSAALTTYVPKHKLDFKIKLSLDPNALEAFRLDLQAESGLEVIVRRHIVVMRSSDRAPLPKTVDDLIEKHDGGKVIAQGNKEYKDVADPWAVVRTKKGHLVVYYSTNGYGFGYDKCVMPDATINHFYEWLGADLDGLLAALLVKRS